MVLGHGWTPSWDLDNGIFRAWWFDPLTATLSFAFFVWWYWYEERIRGLSSDSNFYDTIGIGYGRMYSSLSAYWIGIFIWKFLIPPAAETLPDGFPNDAEGVLFLFSEVMTGIIMYDFYFFFVHWAMHEIPLLKSFHWKHHICDKNTVEARDTLRHSLLDGSLQVLINIMVQRYTPWGIKSRLARALHNFIVVWMLVESHTASPYPYVWRRWFVGVRDHRLHHVGVDSSSHLYGKHHRHQQFFGYLDDARAWWFKRQAAKQQSTDNVEKKQANKIS